MPQLELPATTGVAPGGLFLDAAFPGGGAGGGVAFNAMPNDIFGSVSWKRPHEISPEPRLFVDGGNRSDIVQGALGDCWFLSACIAMAQYPDLLWQIIPRGQVLFGDGYNGMLTFRFWRLGHWETVRIDDRLPVDWDGQLIYSRSSNTDEFWLPLMEKAFAKFHGGYPNLIEGRRMEGLISLTGLLVEDTSTSDWDEGSLFELLESELQRQSLVTCSAAGPFRKGLAGDHTYAVTGARRVRRRSGHEALLLRVRNPWGASADAEWSGAWRDGDPRWNEIDQRTKDSMQYKVELDGEFWMEDKDFAKYFQHISIAMKTPLLYGTPMDGILNFHSLRGAWEKGKSAGGSQKNMKLFATNPQFSLIVKETDDSYIEGNSLVDYLNVVLEIVQDLYRKKYRSPDAIALFVYKVHQPARRRLSARELAAMVEFGDPAEHEARSSVVYRLQLPPGAYVLVASTFRAGRTRSFLLRSYSRRRVDLRQL